MNAGRLAVVEGIEGSEPLNCSEYLGVPKCTRADIDKRLNAVYKLGVRQMELTNKFDNALTGVTGDDGTTGLLVNSANRYQTGHYWEMGTCPKSLAPDATDKSQYNLADQTGQEKSLGRDSIFGAVLSEFGHTGIGPVYPQGPQCNKIGLTPLGRYAIGGLMRRGMMFDPDHMSALARQASMKYVASRGYSGVVSSHSWADDPTYQAVLHAGGVVTPHGFSAPGFIDEWRKLRSWADPRFLYGIGYGSDVNGFSAQPGPLNPKPGQGVRYPFVGFGGVLVHKQRSGQRVYNVNTDGVDHYGLWPDYFAAARLAAGSDRAQFEHDLELGPEAFLEAWERGIGIAPDACRSDVPNLSNAKLEDLHRGMTPEQVLQTLGQPHTRVGNTFSYCTSSGRAVITFDRRGRVTSSG